MACSSAAGPATSPFLAWRFQCVLHAQKAPKRTPYAPEAHIHPSRKQRCDYHDVAAALRRNSCPMKSLLGRQINERAPPAADPPAGFRTQSESKFGSIVFLYHLHFNRRSVCASSLVSSTLLRYDFHLSSPSKLKRSKSATWSWRPIVRPFGSHGRAKRQDATRTKCSKLQATAQECTWCHSTSLGMHAPAYLRHGCLPMCASRSTLQR